MPKITDRPRYYVTRQRGGAYWAPGKWAREFGFLACAPLGPDGPEAKKKAIDLNDALDAARIAARTGKPEAPTYPPGSLGSFYLAFQDTEAWRLLDPATHEDYRRAWPIIEARFGRTLISRITPDDSERFHVEVHPSHTNRRDPEGELKLTWNTAYKTLRTWRTLLNALVAYRLIPPPAPTGRVSNPQPPGRTAVWLWHEVETLIETAHAAGDAGMAAAITLAWEAMLSPIDVRQLPRGRYRRLAEGAEIDTRRGKTGKPVWSVISEEGAQRIDAYIQAMEARGVILDPEAPLIRNTLGRPHTITRVFAKAFRRVVDRAFPGDVESAKRQMLDLRRSAATEARMGGATKDDLGAAMANTLGKDETLQSTYVRGASTKVLEARKAGRQRMAEKFRNADE